MSKENVVFFSRAVSKIPDLGKQIADAPATIEAWVEIAREAGFEFTPAEFAAVVEETLGRKVRIEDAVSEYIGAQTQMGDLSPRTMDRIVGGLSIGGGWWGGGVGGRIMATNS